MDDLISRQAAIRWVKTECNPYGKPTLDFESGKKVIEHLAQMLSAQPEQAVKDCRNCKHGKYNDYHDTYFCYNTEGCTNWDKWEASGRIRKEEKRMLINKEKLIQCLRDSMWEPKELSDVLMTIDEQPAEYSADAFIKAFRKASFDLVSEYNEARVTHPDIASMVVKNDDDGLWIRFTAIGSLLDYCKNEETESVFEYCAKGAVVALLIDKIARGI